MMDWLESLALGAVQGLTEFLPVSSDGHLAVTQQFFARLRGHARPAADDVFFDILLHVGTLVAILIYYRAAIAQGFRGLCGASDVPEDYRRPALIRTGFLAFVATLPLVPDALFFKKWIEQAFQSPTTTGVGFLITAAVLLVSIKLKGGDKGPRETMPLDALLVGLAQMFAPLPGVSRSGLTIATALALGFRRSWAVGFSLLIAVPAILGAVVFEIKKVDPSTLAGDRLIQLLTATILAGLIGYFAIVWLVRIVGSGRLWYFSVYLVVLAGIVLATAHTAVPGAATDAGDTPILDGAARPGGPPSRPGWASTVDDPAPLDRADADGEGSARP